MVSPPELDTSDGSRLAAGAGTGPALTLVQPPVPLGDPTHPGSGVPIGTVALRGAVRAHTPPLS